MGMRGIKASQGFAEMAWRLEAEYDVRRSQDECEKRFWKVTMREERFVWFCRWRAANCGATMSVGI
jgi:hypothetical protein